MKSIMGLVDVTGGQIHIEGRDITNKRPFEIARAGLGFVPEEREVFANLTVDENLRMGEQPRRADAPFWTVEQMFDYFPRLKERRGTRAGNLSGGEQQMLTMCRSLLGNPKVMLIDEPTEGLAPKIVEVIADVIRDIHQRGVSVVLVEQKLTIALKVSTRVSVMGHGRIVSKDRPPSCSSARTWSRNGWRSEPPPTTFIGNHLATDSRHRVRRPARPDRRHHRRRQGHRLRRRPGLRAPGARAWPAGHG